jgi:negative regulator of sigma-B (phosphoserine phosphatase)
MNLNGERVLLDFGVSVRAAAGHAFSGDLHFIKTFPSGALIAVVDGIGHGSEATAAARVALNVLESHAQEPVGVIFETCHVALAQTRGAVMTLASLNASTKTLTWLGVGNVEARLFRADAQHATRSETPMLRGGLLGYQLPALHPTVTTVAPGDLLVFATDGIRAIFDGINRGERPARLVEQIMAQHCKGNDDALVLAVRYLGAAHE